MRIDHISAVFNDTSTSYKLFWFRGILEILKRRSVSGYISGDISITIEELLAEMVSLAWTPTRFFHLSLGKTDRLQGACEAIQDAWGGKRAPKKMEIQEFISTSPDVLDRLWHLATYVPALFLSPWFLSEMKGIDAGTDRVKKARELAFEARNSCRPPPYWLEGTGKSLLIRFNSGWQEYLLSNLGLIDSFVDHHLSRYLQARNPSTPGIVNKIRMPSKRKLGLAREFWEIVRNGLTRSGKIDFFKDIYSGDLLTDKYSIDHFLPWSFLVHDQLWNLVPVAQCTNSKKSDNIPDIGIYLPMLTELHWQALHIVREQGRFHTDYVSFFGESVECVLCGGRARFEEQYQKLIEPLAQLAINQGFKAAWEI